ncbi:MAG TPA: glycosyltransferase family 4 protein [Vicinamibacterales bacterium]
MRILYSAIDQTVPGTKGGSVHVAAVAEGLAALGHEVTALVTPGPTQPAGTKVRWIALPPPLGSPHLRLWRSHAIGTLARGFEPDVVIERYHNFGGEAIRLARSLGATAVLEINSPVVDHPGSRKALADRLLLVEPMRRWREHICRLADVIVTPNAATVPAAIAEGRLTLLEWGADTTRFRPGLDAPPPFRRPDVGTLAIFAGAFRSWHGAVHLVRAVKAVRASGRRDLGAVLVGDGPELAAARAEAAGVDGILFTGALPHDLMPAALAAADIGVAPFEISAHPPLAIGFYWSPLKLFEYMAAGLPVAAPAVDRIPQLVAHEREGLLYDPADAGALANALLRLTDPALRTTLGAAARDRAALSYSWDAHCRGLVAAIELRRGVTHP